MLLKSDLFELLRVKGLDFQIHNHEPLYTVEDSEKFRGKIKGSHTKNLFLKNKKNSFFLFSCDEKATVEGAGAPGMTVCHGRAPHCCAQEPSLGLTTMSSVMSSRSMKCLACLTTLSFGSSRRRAWTSVGLPLFVLRSFQSEKLRRVSASSVISSTPLLSVWTSPTALTVSVLTIV